MFRRAFDRAQTLHVPRRGGRLASSLPLLLAAALLVACGSGAGSTPAAPAAPAVPPASTGAQNERSGAVATAVPRERLTVAYSQRSVSQGMHIYGIEGGYFDQQGLDIETTQIPGANLLTAAMIAGEVQIGTVGASSPTEARLAGADLVTIADTTPVMVFWVISRPEIKSVPELRGKRIGVTRVGTALHYGGRVTLRHYGLDPEQDAIWINMSTLTAIVAGVEANSLDAGVVTPVEKQQALGLGLTALFDIGTISPPFSQAGLATTGKLARERPDLVLRYLRGHLDGLKRLRADPAWGKAVMARWLQTDDQTLIDDSYETYVTKHLPAIPTPKPDSVTPIIELLALTDPRASTLRAEDIIEPRFMQQLEAEGFFQQPPGAR